jgi:hypothetical protein
MVLVLVMLLGCGSGVIEASEDDDDGGGLDTGAPADDALCINELMPDNAGALVEDDETPDWIELYNAEYQTISLVGWTLQVDDGAPVPLDPLVEVEATEPILLFADGVDDVADGHLPFTLDAEGGSLTLTGPNGTGERIRYGVVQTNHAVARETDCCAGPDCLVFDHFGSPGEENGE